MEFVYITFDLDDTLVKTNSGFREGFIQVYQGHFQGKTDLSLDAFLLHVQGLIKDKTVMNHWKTPRFFTLLASSLNFQGLDSQASCTTFLQASQSSNELFAGVPELLAFLSTKPVKLAIVSNCSRERIADKLSLHGLLDFFDPVISCKDEGVDKESTQAFSLFLERAGVPAAKCIHIGDHIVEDMAAKRLGFTVVLHDYKNRYSESESVFDYRVGSMTELKALFAQLFSA